MIDLRSLDGTGKRLQMAGLKTLGEIDPMPGPELLKLPGLGVGVIKSVRGIIKTCKSTDRRRKRSGYAPRPEVSSPSPLRTELVEDKQAK